MQTAIFCIQLLYTLISRTVSASKRTFARTRPDWKRSSDQRWMPLSPSTKNRESWCSTVLPKEYLAVRRVTRSELRSNGLSRSVSVTHMQDILGSLATAKLPAEQWGHSASYLGFAR